MLPLRPLRARSLARAALLTAVATAAAAAPPPAGAAAPAPAAAAPAAATAGTTELAATALSLPGGPPVGMDYLAFDASTGSLWIPAGNTARVDVLDTAKGTLTAVEGFATEKRGERTAGPSSAAAGDGFVYVGNRAGSQVCAVEARTLTKRGCVALASSPDGLQAIAATHELWVTTPHDKSITVLDLKDPAAPAVSGRIAFEGEPEGYAVDQARGVFFTNLEDKDRTLGIDVRRREIIGTWLPGCGEDGPRGLAIDRGFDFLFVACQDRVMVLDVGGDGKRLSTIDVGDGIDDIGYVESRRELYAAAARAGKLTIARLEPRGVLTTLAVVPTVSGARNAVATEDGTAYLTDSPEGKILVVAPIAR
jgi:DNA-binding beta-propeller fold protein YncE